MKKATQKGGFLVDSKGIEPSTLRMRTVRSATNVTLCRNGEEITIEKW